MRSKYTSDFDPNIERKLDDLLAYLADEVALSPECLNIKYLVLGGGYGRGEGGIYRSENGSKLYNDLDFFVLAKSASDNSKMDAFFKAMSEKLGSKLGIEVDFCKSVPAAYAADRTDMLMWREMAIGGRVVVGDEQAFKKEFSTDGNLSPREFAKLMYNRCSGLLFAREKIRDGLSASSDADFVFRNINKTVLACADVVLAKSGIYKFKVDDRLAALSEMDLPSEIKRLKSMYADAVEFKKRPFAPPRGKDLADAFVSAREMALSVMNYAKDYLSSDNSGLSGRLANFSKMLKVRKYFKNLGMSPSMFSNPVASGLQLLNLMLSEPDASASKMRDYVEIWKRIN